MSTPLSAHALRALAWLAGCAGPGLRGRIAARIADRALRRNTAIARVAARNLRLVGLDASMARATLVQTVLTFVESLNFWTRPRASTLGCISGVEGLEHLEAAERAGAVVVVAPHYGNWELLLQWVAARRPTTLLYTRGKSPAVDGFLRRVRERDGVTAVPADAHGLRPLLMALKRRESLGITPDQTPDDAGGRWSPFFGVPALTMTLLHRLAARHPETCFVLAAAERDADGRFRILVQPLPASVTSGTVQDGVDALNLAIEAMVRRDPTQYQWTYKRFKGQRPGEPLVNPYWPECY